MGESANRELLLGTPAAKTSFTSSKPLLLFLLNLILPVNTCHSKHLKLLVVQLLYTQNSLERSSLDVHI